MTVQEVARNVMRVKNMSQANVAEKAGLPGQTTVSMYLRGKSMRVDSLLTILNACGYELVARSTEGQYPEYVIGEEHPEKEKSEEDRVREMVRSILADEMKKSNK